MAGRRHLAIVGDLADLPEPLDRGLRAREARMSSSRATISSAATSSAVGARTSPASRGCSARLSRSFARVAKSRSGLRHCRTRTGSKWWFSSASHDLGVEGRAAAGGAEGAVAHVAAGAAGDLPELGRIELAEAEAVELLVGREGDVVDVEVEAHADGVGGDEVVDVAGLVELDLGVAGARRQRAEHDRRAAALAADQLGDGVDLLGREGDDGRARRQARDLLLAGEGELRQARPRRPRGRPASAPRRSGRMVAEPMSRVSSRPRWLSRRSVKTWPRSRSRGELDLVDGDEGEVEVARHRLDGARSSSAARPA